MALLFSRNPTDPPIKGSQILGVFLYLFLFLISVWATGESLSVNFGLPKLPAYLIGLAISTIASAMIFIIKNGIYDRQVMSIIGGAFVFLLMWSLLLLTNTHSFFLKSSLQDIRKEELSKVIKELEIISTKSEELLNASRDKFRTDVAGRVSSLSKQITDPNNPGLGPEAQKIINDLQELLEQPITLIAPNGQKSSFQSNRELADGYTRYIIYDLLYPKLTSFDQEKNRVLKLLSTQESIELLKKLKELQTNDEDLTTKEAVNLLSRAYIDYERQYDIIKSKFSSPILGKMATYNIEKLPTKPPSRELTKISSLPRFIRETGGYSQPNFIWAFLLALGVDLGAFMILSEMVLPKQRAW